MMYYGGGDSSWEVHIPGYSIGKYCTIQEQYLVYTTPAGVRTFYVVQVCGRGHVFSLRLASSVDAIEERSFLLRFLLAQFFIGFGFRISVLCCYSSSFEPTPGLMCTWCVLAFSTKMRFLYSRLFSWKEFATRRYRFFSQARFSDGVDLSSKFLRR